MDQIQRYTVYQQNPIQEDGSFIEGEMLTEISYHHSEDEAKEVAQQYADAAKRDVLVEEDIVIEWANGFVENVEDRVNEWFFNPRVTRNPIAPFSN
tara:strand:- start:56 stop:343 length:288 start_codon:yes stop_codon:yes gene_type:complete